MSERRRRLAAILLLLAVASGVRTGLVLVRTGFHPLHDPIEYDGTAASLARGDGWPGSRIVPGGGPTAFHPPVYPLVLAGVYAVTGTADSPSRWRAGLLVQALIGTAAVGLIGLLAWRLTGSRRVGLVAVALAAVYPPLVVWGSSLLTEPLFIVLEMGAILAVLRYRRRSPARLRWAVAAGALTGLATLTRSNGFVLLLPLAFGVWTLRPRLSIRALAAPAALGVAAILVVAPWTIRNAVVLHAFVPVSTELGFIMGGTYNPASQSSHVCPSCFLARLPDDPDLARDYPTLGEADADRRLRSVALDYIRAHPLSPLVTGIRNTRRLLGLDGLWFERTWGLAYGFGTRLSTASVVGSLAAWMLALLGAATRAARRVPSFAWAVPVLLLASGAFLHLEPRYRTLLDPFVLLLAAAALPAARRWAAVRRSRG